MFKEGMNGFCMALADSVPGVSGGTVAFIMGFYDRFIGSIHDLAFGKIKEKKDALVYMAKLGVGWIIGMVMAVILLSALFESHIYTVSSLFTGFIAGAIPLIVKEEKESLKEVGKGIFFSLIGIMLVVGITWANGSLGGAWMDLGEFSIGAAIKVCLENYRTQTVYMILGMMFGSFYAIIMGPTTLEVPQEAISPGNFQFPQI